MQLPQIRLQTERAMLSIRQIPATQEIEQPRAEQSIEQPNASISMESKPAKLHIDQTQAWEDMDLMNILRRTEKFAQQGKSDALEGVGRAAQEGADLMKIENGSNPIVEHAINNAYSPMKTLGIKFIPSPFSVKFNYEPGQLNVDIRANKPNISAQVNKPEHNYRQGKVEIGMEKRQNLTTDFTNLFPDQIIG